MRSKGRTALIACVPMFAVLGLGAVSAAPAFASSAPTVETKPATKVAEKEATLNGVVNPNGASTKYHFEYERGKEIFKTSEVSAGSGTSNVEVSAAVTGLKAEAHYEYRLIASNSNGTTNGKWSEFWTAPVAGLPEFSKEALHKPANAFTVEGSTVVLKEVTGSNFTCDSVKAEGKFLTAKTASIAFKFFNCGVSGAFCKTIGAGEGEITTGTLPAELVYLSKEKHEVGLVVNYHATEFATWTCPTVKEGGIDGSIIVPIAPVNTKTASFTLGFAGKEGVQQPSSFEGAEEKVSAFPTMSLFGGSFEEGSLGSSMTISDLEKVEIKA
jgi:hypothetical protein